MKEGEEEKIKRERDKRNQAQKCAKQRTKLQSAKLSCERSAVTVIAILGQKQPGQKAVNI